MLTVLAGLSEFERDLIRARTSEGRRGPWRAGREWADPSSSPRISGARRFAGATGEPLSDIARSYNVHPSTISRLTA